MRDWLSILVILRRHLVFLGYDGSTVFLVISIVDEHVILFGIDDRFD